MTVPRKLAAGAGVCLMLCALPVAASRGQQGVLHSQTDEVQRAISEALRQAYGELRRRAARAEPEQRELQGLETPASEASSLPASGDRPSAPPALGSDRH